MVQDLLYVTRQMLNDGTEREVIAEIIRVNFVNEEYIQILNKQCRKREV
jgi:hypothetical protein